MASSANVLLGLKDYTARLTLMNVRTHPAETMGSVLMASTPTFVSAVPGMCQ